MAAWRSPLTYLPAVLATGAPASGIDEGREP
ncbi:MAG: hypothetical protein K0R97_1257 [Oerskovia sp.]|jgi:hypothetical protein|nr:hypothetical protein [Oerskovia sp.]